VNKCLRCGRGRSWRRRSSELVGVRGRSPSPILFRFTFHGRRIRVLHFEPIRRAAGTVRRLLPLRDNAFEAKFAGVTKYSLAVALYVLVEPDARPSLGQHHLQRGLAALKWIMPQVVAVQLDQIKRVEEDTLVSAVVTDEINEATPLSSHATASPSMMQERERRRANVSTISAPL
jgi:hypothetical protein